MSLFYKKIKTPVGQLTLVASAKKLVAVLWENDKPRRVSVDNPLEDKTHPVLLKAEKQLQEYFQGKRTSFDIPLEFHGTEFQKKVWAQLQKIPFGERRSYLDLAKKMGRPLACRAVGAANGKNPLSIIVPCHRVIGSNGKLTGFAGGLKNKDFLLSFEQSEK